MALLIRDVEKAKAVNDFDSEIDRQEREILKMITDTERIGDQSEDIAEWVIYSITGEHGSKKSGSLNEIRMKSK